MRLHSVQAGHVVSGVSHATMDTWFMRQEPVSEQRAAEHHQKNKNMGPELTVYHKSPWQQGTHLQRGKHQPVCGHSNNSLHSCAMSLSPRDNVPAPTTPLPPLHFCSLHCCHSLWVMASCSKPPEGKLLCFEDALLTRVMVMDTGTRPEPSWMAWSSFTSPAVSPSSRLAGASHTCDEGMSSLSSVRGVQPQSQCPD